MVSLNISSKAFYPENPLKIDQAWLNLSGFFRKNPVSAESAISLMIFSVFILIFDGLAWAMLESY